jgi:hypothetical protein
LGRLQWEDESQGVSVPVTTWIDHSGFDNFHVANDIALLRIPAVTLTGQFPS